MVNMVIKGDPCAGLPQAATLDELADLIVGNAVRDAKASPGGLTAELVVECVIPRLDRVLTVLEGGPE
jgi:hypothetical protein